MMGVYGKRCLGLVKEGCKGNVRLEVRLSYASNFTQTDVIVLRSAIVQSASILPTLVRWRESPLPGPGLG